jgi:hypothetical protein
MPPDPFSAPDELVTMMKGMWNLHSAAQIAGFPEAIATQFVIGVFTSLMANAQGTQSAPEAEKDGNME